MYRAGAELARRAGCDGSRFESRCARRLRRAGWLRPRVAYTRLSGPRRRGYQVLDEPALTRRPSRCSRRQDGSSCLDQCDLRTHADRSRPRTALGQEVACRVTSSSATVWR
jgi:hypothetical protein